MSNQDENHAHEREEGEKSFNKPVFLNEPVTDFNASKQLVKSQENRQIHSEASSSLIYNGDNNSVKFIGYLFKNELLHSAIVLFNSASDMVSGAGKFYSDKYKEKGIIEDRISFINATRTFILYLSVDVKLGLNAIYLPYTKGGRVNAESFPELKAKYADLFAKI